MSVYGSLCVSMGVYESMGISELCVSIGASEGL